MPLVGLATTLDSETLALAAAGATFADVIKFGVFVTDIAILPVIRETRDKHIDVEHPPASTAVQVGALFQPGYLLEDRYHSTMGRTSIAPPRRAAGIREASSIAASRSSASNTR